MLAILASLSGLLGGLPGIIGDYFKTKQQIQLKQIELSQELQLAVLNNQAQEAISNSNRAITSLQSTTQWFKVIVFVIFSIPYVSCLIGQVGYATEVFDNLSALPEWYIIIYTGIIGIIWGIPIGGGLMDLVVKGIGKSVQNRRAYSLAKKGIDPTEYFNALRISKGGTLSQADVDEGNRILEQLNKE